MKAVYKKTKEVVTIVRWGMDGSYTDYVDSSGNKIHSELNFYKEFENCSSDLKDVISLEELLSFIKEDLIDKELAFKIFSTITDKHGYFLEGWIPGRGFHDLQEELLFDEYGYPNWYVTRYLPSYLDSCKDVDWKSDLVKLYHFLNMSSITKGNYVTINAWR